MAEFRYGLAPRTHEGWSTFGDNWIPNCGEIIVILESKGNNIPKEYVIGDGENSYKSLYDKHRQNIKNLLDPKFWEAIGYVDGKSYSDRLSDTFTFPTGTEVNDEGIIKNNYTPNNYFGYPAKDTGTIYGALHNLAARGIGTPEHTAEPGDNDNYSPLPKKHYPTVYGYINRALGTIGKTNDVEQYSVIEAQVKDESGRSGKFTKFTDLLKDGNNPKNVYTVIRDVFYDLQDTIDGFSNIMNFLGVFPDEKSVTPGSGPDDELRPGDVYLNSSDNNEYVYTDDKGWVVLGNTYQATRIKLPLTITADFGRFTIPSEDDQRIITIKDFDPNSEKGEDEEVYITFQEFITEAFTAPSENAPYRTIREDNILSTLSALSDKTEEIEIILNAN